MAPAMEAGLVELRKQMRSRRWPGRGPGQPPGLAHRRHHRKREALPGTGRAGRAHRRAYYRPRHRQRLERQADAGHRRSERRRRRLYVPPLRRSARHFARTVQQMQAVALQRGSLNVRPSLGIDVRNIFRVFPLIARLEPAANQPTAHRTSTLGELERGHGQTLLVEFVVPARPRVAIASPRSTSSTMCPSRPRCSSAAAWTCC